MSQFNNVVRFVKRPDGKPTLDVFKVEKERVRQLKLGEYLLRNAYLSMDPALVGRMRDEDNYVEKVNPGDVMQAYGIGQVIESKNPNVKVGSVRLGRIDMQQYTIFSGSEESKEINLGLASPSSYLGAMGVNGSTAYFAVKEICKPQVGETFLVSAGGSAVGSVAAQIAKNMGCRVVGIVSTDEKTRDIVRDYGFDAAISYRGKSIDELTADINKACPQGVDMYFDNTSGDISEAVLDTLNENARVAVIGRLGISHLADTRKDTGRRDHNIMLTKRVKKQGLVILDYQDRLRGAMIMLARWIKEGSIKGKEDVMHGIDQTPDAFFRMLAGKNKGKQLVKLADIDNSLDPTPRWLGRLLISKWFPTEKLAKKITGGI